MGELEDPSIDLVRLVMNSTYEGQKSQKATEKFKPLVKKSFKQFLSDTMSDRFKVALKKDADEIPESLISPEEESEISKVETTAEELESFAIVKSILHKSCDVKKIFMRDTESYLGVLFDNNNRKWICRVHLHDTVNYITLPDENKKPVRYDITCLDDIYNYADLIIASCSKFAD